jgi:hypothetical protein
MPKVSSISKTIKLVFGIKGIVGKLKKYLMPVSTKIKNN